MSRRGAGQGIRRGNWRGAGPIAALALALIACLPLPLAAQGDDVPVIDLGPVIEAAPAPSPDTAPGSGPESGPESGPAAAPRAVEIVPDEALTLPLLDRTGGAPGGAPDGVQDGAPDAAPGTSRGDPPADTGAMGAPALLLPLQTRQPALDGILRLTGEVQSADFFVDLPLAGAAQDLVLSYRTAINVLPEDSQMLVRVNGTDLPPIRPDAFEGFEQLVLPGALLDTGRNEVTVTLHHAHRIFCGPEASFAIWTEIDLDASGVRIDRADLPADATGLHMALRAQATLSETIPVHLADPAGAGLLAALTPRLAGLRGAAPVVPEPAPLYGAAEAAPPAARITVLPGAGPRAEIRRTADGALVLVLAADPATGAHPDLDALLPLPGPVPDIAALRPGTATALRDLGLERTEVFNRYSEREIAFRLPPDWLILASQKARLRLGYGFAEGLPEGALMLVKINGTTVRLLPLDRGDGTALPMLDIDFPARLLKPGANALTFVAIVPGDPPGLPCPPVSGPLLVLGGQSTLLVPPSPRMRAIGLDGPLAALRPDQVEPAQPERAEAAAGGGLAALVSALRPVEGIARNPAASLTVTDAAAAGQLDPGDLGIGRRDLAQLFPDARRAAGDAALDPAAEADAEAGAATDAARPGLVARLRGALRGAATGLVRLAVPGDGALGPWLEGRRAEAVLLIPRDDAPDAIWLLTAPQGDPQRLAALLAQARLSPQGPQGRLSVLTPEGQWDSWHGTALPPELHEPLTLANFRTVAGNYASWSPLRFVALLMALLAVSIALALVFIVTTRGRRKR